jgi:nicotinate-nucleotide pyrophosphorylase (carboxylating)
VTPFTPEEAAAARAIVTFALLEDLGATGDRTSLATIPANQQARAAFVARTPGVVAGLPILPLVAQAVDAGLTVQQLVEDSTKIESGLQLAVLSGSLRSILIAERTALNFLQRMSGVATLTRQYVEAIAGTTAQVLDTRKTIPGWRRLDKYAVRQGGGTNHRIGLFDGILIKDNHIAGLGDPATAVRRSVELARQYPGNAGLPVEVEVDSLDQLRQVLPAKPEIVLLDNMPPAQLREAVALRNDMAPGTLLEASGGVNLSKIRAIAETGVDRISVGAITHSAPALDIALDYLA